MCLCTSTQLKKLIQVSGRAWYKTEPGKTFIYLYTVAPENVSFTLCPKPQKLSNKCPGSPIQVKTTCPKTL